jgi:hypothetical protein
MELFYERTWPGLAVWAALFVADYLMTIACARLYQAGARDVIVFEGSYEITPLYQKDVNALRRFSPRFVAVLAITLVLMVLLRWLCEQVGILPAYYLGLGALILMQLAIHVRHVRNYALFTAVLKSGVVKGRIEYPRRLMLRMSAVEFFAFSGVYAVIFLVIGHLFLAGGALACLSVGSKHLQLSRSA